MTQRLRAILEMRRIDATGQTEKAHVGDDTQTDTQLANAATTAVAAENPTAPEDVGARTPRAASFTPAPCDQDS